MKKTVVLIALLFTVPLFAQTPAARGDFNTDGSVNTTDIDGLADHLLGSGAAPDRTCSADVNADSIVSPMDALRLIDYVAAGGQAPPAQPSEICDGNDNDCDGQADEDFNVMTDVGNCGQCGIVCENTNATNSCVAGQCIPSCSSGWASCDANGRNGCETLLNTNPACTAALNLGTLGPDGSLETSGRGEQWVRFYFQDTGSSTERARVFLSVPSNVNYDLYVYVVDPNGGSCGTSTVTASSTTQGDETIVIELGDRGLFSDDSADVFVEIRFASGASCDDWRLTVQEF